MARSFVILMPGRTGSSHLVSCLASHPRVCVEGEALVTIEAGTDQIAWIDRHYRRRRFRIAAVGFKTKLKDVRDHRAFADALVRHQAGLVLMLRRDNLRQAVSILRARTLRERHGVWNRTRETPELGATEIDLGELDRTLADVVARTEELEGFVDGLDLPRTVLHYEDLLTDPEPLLAGLQDFLGIPRRDLRSETRKTTPDDLTRSISNHEQVREHLAGGPHERFLG